MAHKVCIGDHIHHSKYRRQINQVDQELIPKVHVCINHSARASYVGV